MFLLQMYFFPKQTGSAGFMNEVWEKKKTPERGGLVWFCPSLKKKTTPQTNQPTKQTKKKEKRKKVENLFLEIFNASWFGVGF